MNVVDKVSSGFDNCLKIFFVFADFKLKKRYEKK